MKVAVTGALGQLGGELCRQIGPQVIPLDIDTLDLTNGKAVLKTFLELRPEAVINCAAYTQVDKAESEPDLAHAVNATAVEHLVRVCGEMDCPLVQISTDYVFGGNDKRVQGSGFRVQKEESTVQNSAVIHQLSDISSHTPSSFIPHPSSFVSSPPASGLQPIMNCPYREDDAPAPLSVYGRTKLAGERAAAQYEKHLIVRTCGLYARPSDARANNFVRTMLRLASTQAEIRVVNDQYCTPSYVPHVACAVLFLAGITHEHPAPWGIYHVTNSGVIMWYDFAVEIFKQAAMEVKITAISTAEYGAPAARPSYSVLDTSAYQRLGGPVMVDWKTALEEYFDEWKKMNT